MVWSVEELKLTLVNMDVNLLWSIVVIQMMLELTVQSSKVGNINNNTRFHKLLPSFIECNDTDVRLVQLAGDMENEGQVEYCSSGRWGLVCNDFWDTNDVKVIYR